MKLAVIVIAAGRADHLAGTLAGLDRQTRPPDDVVVVDMEPARPATVDPPARWLPLVTDGDDGLPLAAARNAGAAATDCDHLVFLDVDCLPSPRLTARYAEVLAQEPLALACGPVRYLRQGWLDDVGTEARDDEALGAASAPHPARPSPPGRAVVLGDDHELFWSLSFGATRTTWEHVGGFDDAYRGYGGEDTDFAFRARALGVSVAWFGDGVAYHQWHPPTRFDDARIPEIVANARRFHARWGTWPMAGWLDELHQRGLVRFDPAGQLLELVSG